MKKKKKEFDQWKFLEKHFNKKTKKVKKVKTEKQIKRDTRREFLLTYFDKDEYQEKEVNGYWLVKSFNKGSNFWQVGIYTKESFKNYKGFQESKLF